MRRRSDRKKTPEVASSPAPTTRRSSRRARRTASPSPEKSDHNSGAEQEEVPVKTRRRTTSTPSKDHSPTKKGRLELNKIVEENGESENQSTTNKEIVEKSIDEEKDRKTDDKKEDPPADEKESDIKDKVRQTDKLLDDNERTTEIQPPKESVSAADEKKEVSVSDKEEKSQSPSKRKREKTSAERQHKKDKDLKSRQDDSSSVPQTPADSTVVVETNGKEVEPSEPTTKEKETAVAVELPLPSKKVELDRNDKEKTTVKKRKWVSRKSSENKIMAISTDSLKSLIADPVHPVPLSDVHLDSSPEIEVVQSETEGHHEEKDHKHKTKEKESHRKKTPEKHRPSKEELEEGEEDSEEEEGQIERVKTSVKTNSSPILYITNLVRPFTIMQLKGLLARTGKIVENGFWIDRIKSKCYVKFDNEDEAIETRHALHGVRWPTSNPKCLNVEFGTEEAMNAVLSSMEETSKPENTKENRMVGVGWDGNGFEEERKVVRQVREWDMGKREEIQKERNRERDRVPEERKEHPKEVDKRNPFRDGEKEEERRGRGERRHRSPSFDKHRRSRSISPARKIKKDNEPPLRLLDDLFRKTKAAPCVYWLPLTPEQIVEKEQRRLKRVQEVEEHRREREKREKERERQRETEREQRRNRNRSGDRDRNRERSRDNRRRSRSRDRRRY